jgi:hypothetical protein
MADFFDLNPFPGTSYPYPQDFPNAGGLPTTTGGDPTVDHKPFPPNPLGTNGGGSGPLAGMSEQQQFQYAMQQLGLTGADLRRTGSKPVTDWLTANGISGWQGSGPEAADWVKTPSGAEIDYLNSNGDAFQWTPDAGSGGGGSGAGGAGFGSGGGQLGLNGPFGATPFNFQFNESDPSYQFLKKEVLGAIQNSQFARGTGLTGGAAKELQDRAAGLASMEYGNEFDRAFRTNQLNFGQGLAANENQFDQNYRLAGMGFNATTNDVNAAGGLGSTGSSYANQVGSLYGDIGNVNAGNIAGNAQARNNFYTGLLNGLPVGSRPYNAY